MSSSSSPVDWSLPEDSRVLPQVEVQSPALRPQVDHDPASWPPLDYNSTRSFLEDMCLGRESRRKEFFDRQQENSLYDFNGNITLEEWETLCLTERTVQGEDIAEREREAARWKDLKEEGVYSVANIQQEGVTCAICQYDAVAYDRVIVLGCHHIYHDKCNDSRKYMLYKKKEPFKCVQCNRDLGVITAYTLRPEDLPFTAIEGNEDSGSDNKKHHYGLKFEDDSSEVEYGDDNYNAVDEEDGEDEENSDEEEDDDDEEEDDDDDEEDDEDADDEEDDEDNDDEDDDDEEDDD